MENMDIVNVLLKTHKWSKLYIFRLHISYYYNIIYYMKLIQDIRIELDSNNHSVFNLNYHLILVIKYRKEVITDTVSEYLKNAFINISKNYNITLSEWNHDKDHVHILFTAHPNSEISKFINVYKSATSRLVKKQFPEIKEKLYKEYFWSRSYCIITAGGAPLSILKTYIEAQGGRDEGI